MTFKNASDEKLVGLKTYEIYQLMVESIVRSLITYDDYFKLIDFGNAKNNFQLIRKYRDRIGHDNPILDFEEFLDDILDRLDKKNTKLLLLLDEFEKIQEGIDSGLTAPQVPQNQEQLYKSLIIFGFTLQVDSEVLSN